jgi:outer membrane lipoprotein carrier protein
MRRIFLMAACCLIFSQSNAQDAKAKAILDGVSQQTKSYASIEIAFSYIMENKKQNLKETKSGTAMMKGEKYRLNFAGQTIISDGKVVWTYIKDANEVQINNVDPNDDEAMSPNKLLTAYDKSFTPKFIKEEQRGARFLQILDLTPTKGRTYYKIRVEIDKAKKQIASATVYDKNGTTTYTYLVNKFTTDKVIPDTKFTFRAADYPGVEVIDLRD